MKTIIGALTMWAMCLVGTAAVMFLLDRQPSVQTGTAVFIVLTMLRVALR